MGHSLVQKPLSALILFSVIFSGVYFFTACEDKGNNNTLKTQYTLEAVNKAIVEATKNQNPSDMKVGQYVKYEDNYQIELAEPKISGFLENKILDIFEDEEKYIVTLEEIDTKFDEDQNSKVSVTEQKVTIAKDFSESIGMQYFKGAAKNGLLTSNISLQNNSELKIYNLRIEDTRVPYPQSIQKKLGCDPLKPCLFNGTRIRFIVHEHINKTDPLEFSVDRIYMTNGSFLNGTYSSCISRFFAAPDRDYYIKQCSVLRDYN